MTDNMEGLVERLRAQAAQASVPSRVLLYEAAAALERQPVREGWRPIESAPDDARDILVYGSGIISMIPANDLRLMHTHWMPLPVAPHPTQGDTDNG